MLYRPLAVFGSIAEALERAGRATFGFLPVPVSAVLLAVVLLAAVAALTAAATIEAIAAQPRPQATTLEDVVAPEGTGVVGWVTLRGVATGAIEIPRDLDGDGEETSAESLHYTVLQEDGSEASYAILVRSNRPLAGEAGARLTLTGVLDTDPTQSEIIAEPVIARALEGVEYSPTRVLVEGVAPPMPNRPSFLLSVVLAATALVLLASWLVPYPIFRGDHGASARPVRLAPLAVGESMRLRIRGTLRTPRGVIRIDRAPARLARMPVDEIARRRWQYWGAALGALASGLEEETLREAGGRDDQLVLQSAHASALLPLGTGQARQLELLPGQLHSASERRPAIRVRGDGIDLTLAFRDEATRARAIAEITAVTSTATGAPAPATARSADTGTGGERPLTVTLAAVLMVALGIATAFGAASTPALGEVAQPPLATALRLAVAFGAAAGLIAGAIGVLLRRDWGRVLLVNLALVGLLVAFVSLISSQVCLQPSGPTYSCDPAREATDRIVSLVSLLSLGFTLWALGTAGSYFGETSVSPQPALN